MKGKVVKVILIILILLLSTVHLVPENVKAQGDILIQIILDETTEADVRPGSECKVFIHGRVISDEPIREVIVKLDVTTDPAWSCTINPAEIIVSPRSEEPFTIIITLTPETSIYTSSMYAIGGTCGYYPGTLMYNLPSITGTIGIRQYSQYMIECSEPVINIQPGDQEAIELTIWNIGNGREIYNLELIGYDELDKNGFTFTLNMKQIEIPEKSNGSFIVKVTAPSDLNALGTFNLRVQVTPDNMNIDDTDIQTFSLSIKVSEEKIIYTTEFQIIIVLIVAAVITSVFYIRWRNKLRKLKNNNDN
jgi:hypothetical protein